MKWAKSLMRISTHEVETVQKRVAEIVERRCAVQLQISALAAELAGERENADRFGEAGLYMPGFEEGVRIRRTALEERLAGIEAEETGARDALAEAFETLKKYEHVIEAARVAEVKEEARRETAELDELGLRRAAK
jgi:flagellar FliJ protein